MQFRLKTFLVVITLVAIVVGFLILRHQRLVKLEAQYASFVLLEQTASTLEPEMKSQLLAMPAVREGTQKKSKTASDNFLQGGYGGTASMGGAKQNPGSKFSYRYAYKWPNDGGFYDNAHAIDIVVSAELDSDSTSRQIVWLKHPDTDPNREIAAWIEVTLKASHDVDVKRSDRQDEFFNIRPNEYTPQ